NGKKTVQFLAAVLIVQHFDNEERNQQNADDRYFVCGSHAVCAPIVMPPSATFNSQSAMPSHQRFSPGINSSPESHKEFPKRPRRRSTERCPTANAIIQKTR